MDDFRNSEVEKGRQGLRDGFRLMDGIDHRHVVADRRPLIPFRRRNSQLMI